MKALGYIAFGLLVVVLPVAVALGWPFFQPSSNELQSVGVRAVRQLPVEDRAWTPTVPRPSTTVPSTTTTYPKPTVRLIPKASAPSPAPVTAASAPASPGGSVQDQIRAGFARFGAHVAEEAVRVAGCETGQTFDPRARNGAHAGLFQISGTYHRERVARLGFTWEQMYEAGPNIAVAADLYAEQGWGPWACRRAA